MGKRSKFQVASTLVAQTRQISDFVIAVRDEYERATREHGGFNSAHEGYAVLLEEVDELKLEVWKKRSKRDHENMYRECVQIAAMALKFAIGVALPAKETK